jgi:hypothetical protein
MVKQSPEYLYFIQDDIKILEKNILTISPEKIDILFNKIASYETLEEHILNAFLIVIQEKKEYYYKKQIKSYDNSILRYIIISLIISVLLLYGLYIWFNDYDAKHHQLNLLINELKPYGITVKEHSKRYYKYTKYWLEVIPTKDLTRYQWVTAYQWIKAKEILNQIYKLHSTMHNKDKWIFLIISCGIFFSVDMLFHKIRQWLKPQYKEHYEKYSFIEKKLQNKLNNIHKNMQQKINMPDYWDELKNLWNGFDPIGVFQINSHWPDDEYHSYIIPTYTLLAKNADFNKIYTHINRIVKEHMGMEKINNQYITNFVHKLQNWYIQRKK